MEALVDFLIHQPWWAIHATLFGVLLACGLGMPVPEDIILFTMGYCAYLGLADLKLGIFVCMIGVLVGDVTIYFLGHHFGTKLTQKGFFKRILPEHRMEKTRTLFHRWGNKLIFVARFMPGLRAPVYFSAGTLQLPFKIFFLYDFLAAIISVPTFVYSMYYFGSNVEGVIKKAHQIQGGIAALIIAIVAFFLIKHFYFKEKEAPQP